MPAASPPSSSRENSPPAPASKTTPSHRLRREHRRVLHPLADESEGDYSPHASIYEASPVASDDEGHKDAEPFSEPFDSARLKAAEFSLLEPASPDSASGSGRRNLSHFSGLSLLETITEQKSVSTINEDEGRGSRRVYAQLPEDSDGSDDDYGEYSYYDYASPTQPLHPAVSSSLPNMDIPHSASPSSHLSVPLAANLFARSTPAPTTIPFYHQPTFRPAVSMNRSYGTLSSHPFHRAPAMGTYSTENEMIARTPDSLDSPRSRSRAHSTRDTTDIWGRLGRGFCTVCCCISLEGDHYT